MPTDRQSEPPRWPVLFLARRDQAVAACFLFLALLAICLHWTWQTAHSRRLIEIDQVEPNLAEFQVDVNAADWQAQASVQLRGVGPFLGKMRTG